MTHRRHGFPDVREQDVLASAARNDLEAVGPASPRGAAHVGRRPVVVLSRDAAIPRLRRALIGPCTTTVRGIPSEVRLEPTDDPIPCTSVVNLDSVESVSIAMLVERLGRLSDEQMRQICDALEVAVACGHD